MLLGTEFEVYRQEMNYKLAAKYLAASKVNLDVSKARRTRFRGRDVDLLHIPKWSVLDFVDGDELPDVMDRLMSAWNIETNVFMGQMQAR